ncbi:MAG: hypothetical protein HRT52_08940 [Colwellia sp.]|nr:hypothetical protein [Colwellia sp.]
MSKYTYPLLLLSILLSSASMAYEQSFKGLIDIRAVHVNSDSNADSYLSGDYGKFRYGQGTSIALSQLAIQYKNEFYNQYAVVVVANAFADDNQTNVGITEGYLSYKGLPSASGWRYKAKLGLFYPQISLENNATAWSTPYTLTSSTLNNWVGEEFRHSGGAFTLEKLGKFSKSKHDFSLDVALFQNNDTAGAMLAWHGWALGSRQTLLQEKLTLPDFSAREGMLKAQAAHSDPFIELDSRWGIHLVGQWRWQHKLKANIGYYDNNADTTVVKKGQYAWSTKFSHMGFKYKLNKQLELIAQYMKGTTFMQSPYGDKVVDNDFYSTFIMLRKYWQQHHIALRIEAFSVDDNDSTEGDNNDEDGTAITLSYRFKLGASSFIHTEYNWLESTRASRSYVWQPIELTEQQLQVAYRYYF